MKEAEGAADAAAPDPRLVAIVERLFERCYADGQYEQARHGQRLLSCLV